MPEMEGTSLSEESRTQPVEFYGVSKLAVENYILVFKRLANLRAIILRMPWVYGKDVRRAILADLLYPSAPGPVQLYHSPDDIFDFIHVDDVVRAMINAAESSLNFGVFNISSGIPVKCEQVIEIFKKEVAVRPSHRNHRAVLDNSLARRVLEWEPRHSFMSDAKSWWSAN